MKRLRTIAACAALACTVVVAVSWFVWPGRVFWVDLYWTVAIDSGRVDPTRHEYPWTVAVDWSPDGSRLASAGYHRDVLLWDVERGELAARLAGHRSWVQEVVWFGDGRHLVSADWAGTAIVWDPQTRRPLAELGTDDGADIFGIGVHPGGDLVALGTYSGRTHVLDWRAGERVVQLDSNEGGTLFVIFSPDGSQLATAGEDGAIRLFETQGWSESGVFAGHAAGITALSFSTDGSQVLSCGDDGMARLWDASTGTRSGEWLVSRDWVNFCSFVPGTTQFLTAGTDGTIRLWDVDQGDPLLVLPLHAEWAQCVRPSRDGRSFASAGKEGTVQVYDLAAGRLQRTFDVAAALSSPGEPRPR